MKPWLRDTSTNIYEGSYSDTTTPSYANLVYVPVKADTESDEVKLQKLHKSIDEFINGGAFLYLRTVMINELDNIHIHEVKVMIEKSTIGWHTKLQFQLGSRPYYIHHRNLPNSYHIQFDDLSFVQIGQIPYITNLINTIKQKAEEKANLTQLGTNQIESVIREKLKHDLQNDITRNEQRLTQEAIKITKSDEFREKYNEQIYIIVRRDLRETVAHYVKFVPKEVFMRVVDEGYIKDIMES